MPHALSPLGTSAVSGSVQLVHLVTEYSPHIHPFIPGMQPPHVTIVVIDLIPSLISPGGQAHFDAQGSHIYDYEAAGGEGDVE